MRVEANDLPADWKLCLLDSVTKRGSGHTPNKQFPTYWNGGIKWVSLSDSNQLDNGYICKTDKEISEEGLKNSSAVLHPKGTVVLSRDAGVGKSAVLADEMAVSQHFIAWKCDSEGQAHNWFLYYFLQYMKKEFERIAVGSTIKTIGLPYFKKLKIPYPPYAEQTRIANIIGTWDKAIDMIKQLIENSRAQKKSLLQQLLSGKAHLKGKQKWTEYKLGDVCTMLRGKELSKGKLTQTGKYKCVLYGELYTIYEDIIHKVVSSTDSNEGLVSQAGDILVPSSTTTTGIDLANAVSLNEDGVRLGGDIIVLRTNTNIIDSNFLAYLLTHHKKHDIARLTQGITIIHLYGSDLKGLNISLPDISEQKRIASVLINSDSQRLSLEDQLNELQTEKKALMQQLLTGKRRVKIDKGTTNSSLKETTA